MNRETSVSEREASVDEARAQDVGAPTSYAELAALLEQLPLLVREARRARGLTYQAAAEAVGVSLRTLIRIERAEHRGDGPGTGRSGPSLDNVIAVLRWLDQR